VEILLAGPLKFVLPQSTRYSHFYRRKNIPNAGGLRNRVSIGIMEGTSEASDRPHSTNGPINLRAGSLDISSLTQTLIEHQRERVFKAIAEERAEGKGLNAATSVELKRLVSMIALYAELDRGQGQTQHERVQPRPVGPVSEILSTLAARPRRDVR
jgi:hypothetical protein